MNMLEGSNAFLQNSLYRWVWRIMIALFLITLGFIFFWWNRLPPSLPLFYSLPWGTDQLATPLLLLLLTMSMGMLFMANTLGAMLLLSSFPLFSRLLFFGSVGVSFLALVTIVRIIFLVL